MTKDKLRQTISQSYDNCLDYDELEVARLEIIDLNTKMYNLRETELDMITEQAFTKLKLDKLDLF